MNPYNKHNNRIDYNLISEYDIITSKKCKCGHVISFHSKLKNINCRYCGRINFFNKKAEFDYRVKRRFCK